MVCPSPMGRGWSSYASRRRFSGTKRCLGTFSMAARTRSFRMPLARICSSTILRRSPAKGSAGILEPFLCGVDGRVDLLLEDLRETGDPHVQEAPDDGRRGLVLGEPAGHEVLDLLLGDLPHRGLVGELGTHDGAL